MKSLDQPPKSPEKLGFQAGVFTLPNEDHPELNIDSNFSLPERGAFGVFDGMGTKPHASVASAMARDYVEKEMTHWTENISPEETGMRLKRILLEASYFILKRGEQDPELKGMCTTASVVKFCQDTNRNKKAVIANAEDSQVYVLRVDGVLEAVTLDDTRLNEYLKSVEKKTEKEIRAIQSRYANCTNLSQLSSEEQNYRINRKQLTANIGFANKLGRINCQPRIHIIDFNPGDILVIVSDGIHDNLVDPQIAEIVGERTDNKTKAEKLVRTAWEIGHAGKEHNFRSKKDDLTAIVVSDKE